MTFLTKGGLIEKVAPKQYRITERGRAFLAAHPEGITTRDLEAIDGWEEAWNVDVPGGRNAQAKDSDDDESSEADPEIIEARIKRKIERALPEPSIRIAVLEFLAYAIEKVDEEQSHAWWLRETRRGFELKAGRLLALQIKPLMLRLRGCGERLIWTTTRLRRSPICRNWSAGTYPSQNRAGRRRNATNRTPMMTHLSCRVSRSNVVVPRFSSWGKEPLHP